AADGTREELVAGIPGATSIRLEAVVGPDRAKAIRLLQGIRGVRSVADRGRLGVHDVFDLSVAEGLRQDVGALAAQQGGALRELSWRRPTLEELFARIALGGDEPAPVEPALPAPAPVAAPKVLYNLNPFDQGAHRDLGKPKAEGELR